MWNSDDLSNSEDQGGVDEAHGSAKQRSAKPGKDQQTGFAGTAEEENP
ncbi:MULTISPECIES: hypothetical protein [Arthrobacter]|nr:MULTISPECIES: hypothetical protein [Arthrobacter]MBT8161630.1 hypothetical protein [Arthrobacter sp. GN70]